MNVFAVIAILLLLAILIQAVMATNRLTAILQELRTRSSVDR